MAEAGTVARIYVLAGPDLARSFALSERATLGRSDECDVVLHDRSISRKHALVARLEGGWFLQDLGSTNGISRGGKRLERFELMDGDEFKLGDLPLRFRLAEKDRPDEVELAFAPAPVPAAHVAPVPLAGLATRPAPTADAEPELEEEIEIDGAGEQPALPPALQPLTATTFSAPRVARRTGIFSGELEQHPWWWRVAIGLLLLAFSAGLCYGAFWAVNTLRAGP